MSAGSLKVKIFDAKGTKVIPVAKSTVTVGSAPHCDVTVEHESVQAEHVRAWLEGGRIWIQDLGTSGGTFLNGIRLPGLKPMLVRDLDVLKLGESSATIGMEANLVRAPIVKVAAPTEETTQTGVRPLGPKDVELEKRRDDLAKVSRELAELRLQLQMGRLEKSSSDELRKQLNSLREEMRLLGDQRDELNHVIEARLVAADQDVARRMQDAELEIRQMRDNAGRKLGHWKVDMVAELSKQVHQLSIVKTKQWVTRQLSQDMVFEWEADLNQMFRRVLLEQDVHDDVPEVTKTQPLSPYLIPGLPPVPEHVDPPPLSETTASHSTTTSTSSSSIRYEAEPRPKKKFNWGRASLGVIGLFAVGGTLWAKPWNRHSPSTRSLSSQATTVPSAPSAVLPAPPPPPVTSHFAPKQTKVFRKTYTENVLYTENFADAEFNQTFHQRWMTDLSKAAHDDWHVDDKTLLMVTAKEIQLIQDLQKIKDGIQLTKEQQGIASMRARETAFQGELQGLLRDPSVVERYHRLKHSFYTRNQQYLSKAR